MGIVFVIETQVVESAVVVWDILGLIVTVALIQLIVTVILL